MESLVMSFMFRMLSNINGEMYYCRYSTFIWIFLKDLYAVRENIVKCMVIDITRLTTEHRDSILLPEEHNSENNSKIIKPLALETDRRLLDTLPAHLLAEFKKKDRKGKEANLYEPYWVDGDWVFDVSLPPRKYKRPTPKTTKATTPAGYTGTTMNSNSTYDGTNDDVSCSQHCLGIYEGFGEMCAQRFDLKQWKYEYKQFHDLCEMETANCRKPSYRPMWYPLHRGLCPVLTTYRLDHTNITAILDFKNKYDPTESTARTTSNWTSTTK